MHHHTAIAVPVLLLALLGGPALLAQSGQAPAVVPQQPPIKTGVNLVRVDVYPSKDGVPVLDLRAEDFEVFEDGAPQQVENFEHVVVRPAGPQSERVEPSSQRESLQAAANPRSRVFVIFLDTPHVMVDSAYRINEPLIRLVDRLLGPDDLVGVMTPAMSAAQITLGRKTQVIEENLRRNWPWGTRFTYQPDQREMAYEACYPEILYGSLAAEMIHRKRERATLEALEDLVRYLHGVREERKAILTVTEGWRRYTENRGLMRIRDDDAVPGREPILVGPTGQPTMKDERNNPGFLTKTECDTDRLRLATLDNEQFFRDLVDDANRANATFYPIDPRGLPVFDTPMRPRPQDNVPVVRDQLNLKDRMEAMRELAVGTDGIAVMDSNDLDRGLKRISDDLTSYYLLGYYSTNTKLDGSARQIRVRVKRPGVSVRARRGYRAATVAEATVAGRATEPASAAASSAFTAAMGSLGRIRPDARLRINASVLASAGAVWVAGEIPRGPTGTDDMSLGGTADIEVNAGSASTTARVQLKPGERTFLTALKLAGVNGGEVDVRARLTPDGGTSSVDAVRVDVGPATAQPLLFRRGPTTGNRILPAADFRFSRSERLRLEIPVAPGAKPGAGRVLDKAGTALGLAVTVGEKLDQASGQLWITADVTLAPLAPSDYAIEVAWHAGGTEQRIVTAIRVTR